MICSSSRLRHVEELLLTSEQSIYLWKTSPSPFKLKVCFFLHKLPCLQFVRFVCLCVCMWGHHVHLCRLCTVQGFQIQGGILHIVNTVDLYFYDDNCLASGNKMSCSNKISIWNPFNWWKQGSFSNYGLTVGGSSGLICPTAWVWIPFPKPLTDFTIFLSYWITLSLSFFICKMGW